MANLTIELKINLGVTDRLERLLTTLFGAGSEESPAAEQLVRAALESAPEKAEEPEKAEPQKAEEPEKSEPQEADEPKYDSDYARSAIKKLRQRIEGEDWEQNTTGELYKRYHRAVTEACKQIAMQLSGGKIDKPTLLEPEQVRRFALSCEELYVDDSGELQTKLPF